LFPEEQRSEKEKRALARRSVTCAGEIAAGFAGIPDTVQLSDINEHGMYFTSYRKIAIGEVMNLLVTLPAEASPATVPERVSYRIKVRRVQELALEGKFGIAASIIGRTVFADPHSVSRDPTGMTAGEVEVSSNQASDISVKPSVEQ
jgi:hypothetical protein